MDNNGRYEFRTVDKHSRACIVPSSENVCENQARLGDLVRSVAELVYVNGVAKSHNFPQYTEKSINRLP